MERRWKGPQKGVSRWCLWEFLGIKIISGTTGNTSPGSFLQKGGVQPAMWGRERKSIKEAVIVIVFTSEGRFEGEMG